MDRKIRVVKFLLCICKGLHVRFALASDACALKPNEYSNSGSLEGFAEWPESC